MIHIELRGESVLLYPDNSVDTPTIRNAIPGIAWDGKDRHWTIPLKRRSILALRRYLTGMDVSMASEVIPSLRACADAPAQPDITVEDSRIVIRFEFHTMYQNFVLALGATARQDGSWSLPLESAHDLNEALQSGEVDLLASDDVLNIKPEPIADFDGTLSSLRSIGLDQLKTVRSNVQSVKARKKTDQPLIERMEAMGIANLYDLATYFPLRYLDRSNPMLIRTLVDGEESVVVGKIHSVSPYDSQKRMVKVVVEDAERRRISATFFSQPWVGKRFRAGQDVLLSGTFGYWTPRGGNPVPQMNAARIDPLLTTGRQSVIPIYPQSEKNILSTFDITRATGELFARLGEVVDDMPPFDGMSVNAALRAMHFPENMQQIKDARARLIHDELLLLQLHILSQKKEVESAPGIEQPFVGDGMAKQYVKSLPYSLTGAQVRVLNEIGRDLASKTPMHRLLQGDVSSGKTTIAHALMLNAVDNGHQGVILAPTEILAEQLFIGLASAMPGVNVEFLGTKVSAKKKREEILDGLASGAIDVLVGTHAVLVDNVVFKDLSMVVIDEQHRFGAAQRSILRGRGAGGLTPDMLVMTATPIPRTGAMVLYGDLDISVLDELPPGRIPIATEWLRIDSEESLSDWTFPAWEKIRSQVAEGRQAYVVASLVEDSDSIAAASTDAAFETLSNGVLSDLRLGKVHGKMKRSEREEVMSAFAAGDIDVLVATTVIEVGVNVPNATVMVVLDAGRFGIAQLHQIRGRVGRASWQSVCYLVGEVNTPSGGSRMDALTASTDGFYLAERDLEIRGEGALFGTRQSGESDLMLASIRNDFDVLVQAREEAQAIIANGGDVYDALLAKVADQYQDKEIAS